MTRTLNEQGMEGNAPNLIEKIYGKPTASIMTSYFPPRLLTIRGALSPLLLKSVEDVNEMKEEKDNKRQKLGKINYMHR